MRKTEDQAKADRAEFEAAVRPAIEYLAKKHHPHTCIQIDSTHAELLEGQLAFRTEEYLRD